MLTANQITTTQKQKNSAQIFDESISAENELREINHNLGEKKTIAKAKKLKLPYIDILNTPINADLISKLDTKQMPTTSIPCSSRTFTASKESSPPENNDKAFIV